MLDVRRAILRGVSEAQNDDPVEPFRVGFARILEEGEPPWELIADDFVWDMSGVPWAEQDEYVGHAGFTKFWREWTEAWEDWRLEPVEFIPIGEQMVIVSHQTGRAKASGVPVEMTRGGSRTPESCVGQRPSRLDRFLGSNARADLLWLRANLRPEPAQCCLTA